MAKAKSAQEIRPLKNNPEVKKWFDLYAKEDTIFGSPENHAFKKVDDRYLLKVFDAGARLVVPPKEDAGSLMCKKVGCVDGDCWNCVRVWSPATFAFDMDDLICHRAETRGLPTCFNIWPTIGSDGRIKLPRCAYCSHAGKKCDVLGGLIDSTTEEVQWTGVHVEADDDDEEEKGAMSEVDGNSQGKTISSTLKRKASDDLGSDVKAKRLPSSPSSSGCSFISIEASSSIKRAELSASFARGSPIAGPSSITVVARSAPVNMPAQVGHTGQAFALPSRNQLQSLLSIGEDNLKLAQERQEMQNVLQQVLQSVEVANAERDDSKAERDVARKNHDRIKIRYDELETKYGDAKTRNDEVAKERDQAQLQAKTAQNEGKDKDQTIADLKEKLEASNVANKASAAAAKEAKHTLESAIANHVKLEAAAVRREKANLAKLNDDWQRNLGLKESQHAAVIKTLKKERDDAIGTGRKVVAHKEAERGRYEDKHRLLEREVKSLRREIAECKALFEEGIDEKGEEAEGISAP